MTLLQELKIFVKSIASWIYVFIVFAIFFALFGLHQVVIYGKNIPLPALNKDSFAVQAFKVIEHAFLPAGVQLIVTNPWGGFIAQLEIVLIMAFAITFPFLLYKIIKYCSPALFKHEKIAILKVTFLCTGLFVLGGLFAFYYLIPMTFEFMYPFASSLGIITFFALDAFMSWVMSILITTGVIFLLPIFMIVLSAMGIVPPDFWKRKWQSAFLFLLIFSAIITPDQTGVTMVVLFTPLAALYMGGSVMARRF